MKHERRKKGRIQKKHERKKKGMIQMKHREEDWVS